jgi:hypothetical protein
MSLYGVTVLVGEVKSVSFTWSVTEYKKFNKGFPKLISKVMWLALRFDIN